MQRSRGQAFVELALLLPILLTVVLGAVDLGRLFYFDTQFQSGLREAARYASKHPGTSGTTLATIIEQEGNITPSMVTSVSVQQLAGTLNGETIEVVSGTYIFTFISPWLNVAVNLPNPLRVRSFVAAENDQG